MTTRKFLIIISLFGSIVSSQPSSTGVNDSNQTSPRTKWFRDARVGLIVHWGLYSELAGEYNGKQIEWYGEWIKSTANIPDAEYKQLAGRFTASAFDAREWIHYVKMAGMKYFCLVTKHHDGFCLFDTDQNNDWNVVDATPYKKDIVRELADACRDSGITFAVYYSSGLDWQYPVTFTDNGTEADFQKYRNYFYAQLKELLTNYGKIGYLWFDGEWSKIWSDVQAQDLLNYIRGIDKDVLMNNPKHKGSSAFGDFGLDEENYTPTVNNTDGSINEGPEWWKHGIWERDRLVQENTWAYKTWEKWKTPSVLIRDMIDAASLSWNFCMNIGPKGDGSFPQEAIDILGEFSKWMGSNSESIYGTVGLVEDISVNTDTSNYRITRKEGTYYIHIFTWPSGPLTITGNVSNITVVECLDPSIQLGTVNIGSNEISIAAPAQRDQYATVVALRPEKLTVSTPGIADNKNPVAGNGDIKIDVYDLKGTFVDRYVGLYANGSFIPMKPLSRGTYLMKISQGTRSSVKKMTIRNGESVRALDLLRPTL